MSFRKRQLSAEVEKASKRRDGLRSIDPKIDLGNGLTDDNYNAAIMDVTSKTEKYNTSLSQLDGQLTELSQSERNLAEWSKRMLSGVGSKYGFNSIEYEKAGGVRNSERKRRTKSNGNGTPAK